MNYYSEKDIKDMVIQVVSNIGVACGQNESKGMEVPVEVSARHVHLSKEAVDVLFGKGYQLTKKRELSQPGQYLSEERIKVVTTKGEIANIAVLGPVRDKVQVELSYTDARGLGLNPPLRLSGDLENSGNAILIGPKGVYDAKNSVIVAKAHIHMTPADAEKYHVKDGEIVGIQLNTERPITLDNVLVRVSAQSGLAVHIDYDEANAAQVGNPATGFLKKKR